MNTTGSTTLATSASIAAGATQIYNVSLVVTLKLDDAPGATGDNVYQACSIPGNGPGSSPNQGLYNKADLDRNADGTFEVTDDACGDLPYIVMKKDVVTVTANANGTYVVSYKITVENKGGSTGTYSLTDKPQFDDDITIQGGGFTATLACCPSISGLIIGSPTSIVLATNASLGAGQTDIYTIDLVVSLDLSASSGGDNTYTKCVGGSGNNGTFGPNQGLYNKAELDRNGDGTVEVTDDACEDLPYVIMKKDLGTVTANTNGTYTVTYAITVQNTGGATGTYALKDTPLFDNDVTINSGTYSGQASGSMNTTGSTTLAANASIAAGATHIYNVSLVVTLNLDDAIGVTGDNVYTKCEGGSGNSGTFGPNQGLYNKAELDRNADGTVDVTDDACEDLPYVIMKKDLGTVTANANGTYTVTYAITVQNVGGKTGTYALKDTPQFDADVTINSGTYGGQASGSMNTTGSTTLPCWSAC